MMPGSHKRLFQEKVAGTACGCGQAWWGMVLVGEESYASSEAWLLWSLTQLSVEPLGVAGPALSHLGVLYGVCRPRDSQKSLAPS